MEEERTEKRESEGFYKNALDELVKTYLSRLNEAYDSLSDNKEREHYVTCLKETADLFSSRNYSEIERSIVKREISRDSPFDRVEARRIRCKLGIAPKDLCRLVLPKSASEISLRGCLQRISHLENGWRVPKPFGKWGKYDKLYLGWLKKQGYNPFNL